MKNNRLTIYTHSTVYYLKIMISNCATLLSLNLFPHLMYDNN